MKGRGPDAAGQRHYVLLKIGLDGWHSTRHRSHLAPFPEEHAANGDDVAGESNKLGEDRVDVGEPA